VKRLVAIVIAGAAAAACSSGGHAKGPPSGAGADGAPAEVSVIGPRPGGDAADLGAGSGGDAEAGADGGDATSTTTTKTLVGVCGVPGLPNPFPVALDEAGWLYTVVACDGQLTLYTSPDGGRTVSAPIPLRTAKSCDGHFALAAGRGGFAYVAYGQVSGGFSLLNTTDAGATWNEQPLADYVPDRIRMAAARDTMVVVGTDPLPALMYAGTLEVRSGDGARTLAVPQIASDVWPSALAVRPDGKTAWLVDTKPSILGSIDGGATFNRVAPIDGLVDEGLYVIGSTKMYTLSSGRVRVANLANATGSSFAQPVQDPLAAAIDAADVVTVFGSDPGNGHFIAARLGDNGAATATADLGAPPSVAGAVALSPHATALVSITGDQLSTTVTTWP
jgi:hypothetical protein